MMRASRLQKHNELSLSVWDARSVPACKPFDSVKILINSVDITRPIDVLVPKRFAQERIAGESIAFRKCGLEVPPRMRCSELWVFQYLKRRDLTMPTVGFTAEALIKALPGIAALSPAIGISPEKRNCFLLKDSSAITIWTPEHSNSLVVLRQSWRKALADCVDQDLVFLAA